MIPEDGKGPYLPALTILQPYAAAIMEGHKDVENRMWLPASSYRGPLVIHSGVKTHPKATTDRRLRRVVLTTADSLGRVLGLVDLVDVDQCRGRMCSPWALRGGYFHWRLANPRPLPTPVIMRGAQGLWRLRDPEVLSRLHAVLDRMPTA